MLTSHEEGDEHVGNFVVGDRRAVFVGRVHEVAHHVLGTIVTTLAAAFHSVHVDLGNGALSVVAAVVPGKRGPVKDEVDGGETHIEVVVEVGKSLVDLVANLLALKGVRGGEDGKLGHLLGYVNNARSALEVGVLLEVGRDLVGDNGNIGAERLGGEGDLHELAARQ